MHNDGKWHELNVALNGNALGVRPINPMGVRTVGVEANPSRLSGSCVKLRARCVVHPNVLAPFGHAS